MDFLKLIRGVEDFLFETMVWLILWPKTFVKVVTSPGWTNSFVDSELQRSDEERFDQFLSPLLFFILSIVPEFALKELTPAGANWARDQSMPKSVDLREAISRSWGHAAWIVFAPSSPWT